MKGVVHMTALSRWNPFEEMDAMQNRLSSLFDLAPVRGSDSSSAEEAEWSPLVDVVETADDFQITAELPGVNKEDLNVTLEDGYLQISGKRPAASLSDKARYIYAERAYGPLSRAIEVPDSADASHIEASFKDGLLTVRVPKSEKAKPREIAVTSE
jgi:HSP20 family protein